jgi:hypothetical protein
MRGRAMSSPMTVLLLLTAALPVTVAVTRAPPEAPRSRDRDSPKRTARD